MEKQGGSAFSSEVTMPYATGETPEIGDYIKNQWEQPGTVTRVHFAQDEGYVLTPLAHRPSPD